MKAKYKGNSKASGVYRIYCRTNKSFYIGSTSCFSVRLAKHQNKLRLNKHHCLHLQNTFNKYGEDAFVFEILELTCKEIRTVVEQKYLNKYFNNKLCMNASPVANKHFAENADKEILKQIYGRKKSKEERNKISKSHMGIRKLKDRGYSKEVELFLQALIENKAFPEIKNKILAARQLREAYNKWCSGSKNFKLREKHKEEKRRLKNWLQEQNLWYDARSDSWERKTKKDKLTALKNLQLGRKG